MRVRLLLGHSLRAPWPMRMPNMPSAPCCAANSCRSRFGLLSAHGSSSQGLKTETPGRARGEHGVSRPADCQPLCRSSADLQIRGPQVRIAASHSCWLGLGLGLGLGSANPYPNQVWGSGSSRGLVTGAVRVLDEVGAAEPVVHEHGRRLRVERGARGLDEPVDRGLVPAPEQRERRCVCFRAPHES